MDLRLQLNDSQIHDALSAALLTQLSDDQRTNIITQAITYLTTVKKDHYNRESSSPLQEAFNRALEALASDITRTYVNEHPEVREALETMVEQAAASALANKDHVKRKIQDTFGEALWNAESYLR